MCSKTLSKLWISLSRSIIIDRSSVAATVCLPPHTRYTPYTPYTHRETHAHARVHTHTHTHALFYSGFNQSTTGWLHGGYLAHLREIAPCFELIPDESVNFQNIFIEQKRCWLNCLAVEWKADVGNRSGIWNPSINHSRRSVAIRCDPLRSVAFRYVRSGSEMEKPPKTESIRTSAHPPSILILYRSVIRKCWLTDHLKSIQFRWVCPFELQLLLFNNYFRCENIIETLSNFALLLYKYFKSSLNFKNKINLQLTVRKSWLKTAEIELRWRLNVLI